MIELSHVLALIAMIGTGVVYGTDVFCAVVLRPALARVDDATLAATAGNVHLFGDRRMPIPGVVGLVGSAAAAVLAAVAGASLASASAGAALVLLLVWLLLYVRISAPINRTLTAAAEAHETPADVRVLQRDWDRIIVPRALLQGLALVALCISMLG